MSDETSNPGSEEPPETVLDDDAMRALLDRPLTELTAEELMALKDAHAARGFYFYNNARLLPFAEVGLIAGGTIYAKVFVETLAKHHAEALVKAVRTRFRRKGSALELVVGTEDDAAAALVVTGEMPDEARLAVLDLDVTAEELRGKVLRWDDNAKAWRPDSTDG